MTNIAFTSLVLLVLAFPGYIFLASYFSNEFTQQVLVKSWTDDLAKAILFSLPLHAVGVLIVECLQHHQIIHHTLDYEIAFRMLAGEFSGGGEDYTHRFSAILGRLHDNSLYLLIYYGVILLTAWGLGHVCRYVIWEYALDVRFPTVFGFRSKWLYTIMGRGQLEGVTPSDTMVWVDALTDEPTDMPGKTRIYRGVVAGFSTDEKGALRDLLLTRARRSKFKKDEGRSPEYEFAWQSITPGDYLLLKYDEIKNLNITYLDAKVAGQGEQSEAVVQESTPAEISAPVDQTHPAS